MGNWLQVNEYQTPLTRELWEGLHREVREEFTDIVDKVEFVSNFINPFRRRAADMPKDKLGRIIVDLENPHILEDMSFFTRLADHFTKYGEFTSLYPNPHPNSEYVAFWEEQSNYCKYGKVRESDGEWIPGYYYFYLNFSPILLTEDLERQGHEESEIFKRAERVEGFPRVWDGDYLYFHYIEKGEASGQYGVVLKTRGRGFSFKGGSMGVRNQEFFKKSKSFMMASEKEYLDKDGLWSKYMDNLDFIAHHTPLPSARLKDDRTKMHIVFGYESLTKGIPEGMKSEVMGVTLKNNPNKARGKRGKLIEWEEAGKFPGLRTAWSIARMSLEDGRSVFGYMVAFGTGGTEGADFEALNAMFYNPRGYRILSLRNVFDKVSGKGRCGFFFPEYLNRKNCYDENGNSDVTKALLEVLEDRRIVSLGTSDPNALTQEKADRPITPQEAVMRREGNLFPVDALKDYLSEITPHLDHFLSEHIVCDVYMTQEGAKINQDITRIPIRDFPIKNQGDRIGAVEIFELPITDAYGEIPYGRYIAGIDTYDDDEGASLGSILVMDLWTDRIVAEYSGRKNTAFEFYETCASLLILYNAIGNYEANKKGLYGWFYNNNLLHLLCETPEILRDMNYVKVIGGGNKGVGTNTNKEINTWGRRLQADWMIQLVYKSVPDEQLGEHGRSDEAEENDEKSLPEYNLRSLRSLGYIKEAIAWNPDGNFDRVSAGNMLFILREQKLKYIETGRPQNREMDLSEDDFFSRHFSDVLPGVDIFEKLKRKQNE